MPTRDEEVSVERVPVEEGRYATPSEIGEDEVVMPVAEEEVVTEKRSMVKKEIRVCKDVVEEEEVIEEDVRKEEIDVEDSTTRGGSREASEAEIGEDEVVMPVTEEEVVTEKRAVVKEEIRVRKDVVQDEEVVEEDVRREEVDVEDETTRRG